MTVTRSAPRVLHAATGRPLTLREHDEAFAAAPLVGDLFGELEASGLTGRGGAAFATSRKVDLLRNQRQRHKGVVVNAMEGEPVGSRTGRCSRRTRISCSTALPTWPP
jgi:hypothetical protein